MSNLDDELYEIHVNKAIPQIEDEYTRFCEWFSTDMINKVEYHSPLMSLVLYHLGYKNPSEKLCTAFDSIFALGYWIKEQENR